METWHKTESILTLSGRRRRNINIEFIRHNSASEVNIYILKKYYYTKNDSFAIYYTLTISLKHIYD